MPRLSNIKPRLATADLSRAKVPPKTTDPFYASDEWRKLRTECLKRDHFQCVKCGARAIFADHIVRRRDGGKDELGNLRSLCPPCDHRMKEKWDGSRKDLPPTPPESPLGYGV